MRRTVLSLLLVLPFAALTVGACGGSAFDTGTGGGGKGTGGTGIGIGGTGGMGGWHSMPVGGSSNVGGSSHVGGSTSVGGWASGGAGNAGGAIGVGGSGGLDVQACTSNSECEVVPAGCCSCGQGPVSNFTAINQKYSAQYDQRCGGIACGACPPVAFNPNDPTFYYVATCQAGRCTVVDLGATDVTQCSSASDCTLRSGTACCEGCGTQPVALNGSRLPELTKLVCGAQPSTCLGCVPSFSGYAPGCSNGRCSVLLTPCSTANPCPL